jgi:hypothetical protein
VANRISRKYAGRYPNCRNGKCGPTPESLPGGYVHWISHFVMTSHGIRSPFTVNTKQRSIHSYALVQFPGLKLAAGFECKRCQLFRSCMDQIRLCFFLDNHHCLNHISTNKTALRHRLRARPAPNLRVAVGDHAFALVKRRRNLSRNKTPESRTFSTISIIAHTGLGEVNSTFMQDM